MFKTGVIFDEKSELNTKAGFRVYFLISYISLSLARLGWSRSWICYTQTLRKHKGFWWSPRGVTTRSCCHLHTLYSHLKAIRCKSFGEYVCCRQQNTQLFFIEKDLLRGSPSWAEVNGSYFLFAKTDSHLSRPNTSTLQNTKIDGSTQIITNPRPRFSSIRLSSGAVQTGCTRYLDYLHTCHSLPSKSKKLPGRHIGNPNRTRLLVQPTLVEREDKNGKEQKPLVEKQY